MEIEQGDYKIHDYDANSNQEKVKRKSKRKDKRDLDSDDENNYSCDNCVFSCGTNTNNFYKLDTVSNILSTADTEEFRFREKNHLVI